MNAPSTITVEIIGNPHQAGYLNQETLVRLAPYVEALQMMQAINKLLRSVFDALAADAFPVLYAPSPLPHCVLLGVRQR